MREYQTKVKQASLYVPLVFGCVALVYLGALFLQGYNSGNALPHTGNTPRFVDTPVDTPSIDTIEIADTSNLPEDMPAVPTPAKQAVMHAMQYREQPRVQPARPAPLPPVAQAATSAPTPVNEAVHQVVEQLQKPSPNNEVTPVPEIPEPQTPQIAD